MTITKSLILLTTASSLFADTLTLRNGMIVEGTFLGGTAREIRMDIGSRVDTFPIDTVAGVQFGQKSYDRPRPEGAYSSSRPPSNTPPPAQVGGYDIPAGTQLTVRMIDSVDSENSRIGDTYRASLDEPVIVNGETVISRGANVSARLVEDQKSGKIQGRTILKLILTSIDINGRPVEISTQDVIKESSSRGARSAGVIGGTAALGAIIGGIAGGGRGAAIGAGSGAAVGTGAQELGHGQRVRIPSETRLVFTLAYGIRA